MNIAIPLHHNMMKAARDLCNIAGQFPRTLFAARLELMAREIRDELIHGTTCDTATPPRQSQANSGAAATGVVVAPSFSGGT